MKLQNLSTNAEIDVLILGTDAAFPDVPATSEKWLNNQVSDAKEALGGYKLFRSDKPANEQVVTHCWYPLLLH